MNSVFLAHQFHPDQNSVALDDAVGDAPFKNIELPQCFCMKPLRRLILTSVAPEYVQSRDIYLLSSQSIEAGTRISEGVCCLSDTQCMGAGFIVTVREESIKQSLRANKDFTTQKISKICGRLSERTDNPTHLSGIFVENRFEQKKVHCTNITNGAAELAFSRYQHSLNTKSVSPQTEADQLTVSPLSFPVGSLHGHYRPRRRPHGQQTSEQRLKIKDDVTPRVSARLAIDFPRRSKQYRQHDRRDEREGKTTSNAFLITCRHYNPRQNHPIEMSHFLRESGSRLQPSSIIATAEDKTGLFGKGGVV